MVSIKTKKYFFQRGVKLNSGLPKTYLSKPVVVHKRKSVWPEIAVLLKSKEEGYKGVWVDTFHKKFWANEKKQINLTNLPERIQSIFGKGTSGCWDLILWKGRKVKFIELKGILSKDKIRDTQIKFRKNLLKKGFRQKDFTIIEWDYKQ